MDKKSKIILIISIISLLALIAGISYAYYAADIYGIESASSISLTGGTITINYAEGYETISATNMYPRETAWITKSFTLTANNNTDIGMEYDLGLQVITNTFKGGQLTYSLTAISENDGTSIPNITNKVVVGSGNTMYLGSGSFPSHTTDGKQTYVLKIYFKDNGQNQSFNKNASFNLKIKIGDKNSIANFNECTDTAHPNPTRGDEYTDGTYTYRYMQKSGINFCRPGQQDCPAYQWINMLDDGWSVGLTNRESTNPIVTPTCTSINGKPIINMDYAFDSATTSIDLTKFNTSQVTSMVGTFKGLNIGSLDLKGLDTSNVTDMSYMFNGIAATSIDLSSFDTSNVTDMSEMFEYTTNAIDISMFNTSNVTDMSAMFLDSSANSIDLSTFDTSNVTSMNSMFYGSAATTINVSSFDTSNVTDMSGMFDESAVTILDLSSFTNESSPYIGDMFESNSLQVLDISGFKAEYGWSGVPFTRGQSTFLEEIYVHSEEEELITTFNGILLIPNTTIIYYGSMKDYS